MTIFAAAILCALLFGESMADELRGEEWRYEGEVRDGKPHGQGTKSTAWLDGYRGSIEGTWDDGKPVEGTLTMSGDDGWWYRYEGGFSGGAVEAGSGTASWSDGKFYEGTFLDGKPHWLGVGRSQNGTYHMGWYRDGKPHGFGARLHPWGVMFSEWEDGKEGAWIPCIPSSE